MPMTSYELIMMMRIMMMTMMIMVANRFCWMAGLPIAGNFISKKEYCHEVSPSCLPNMPRWQVIPDFYSGNDLYLVWFMPEMK